jgi:uncharacterized iron-regulated membrane protein
MAVTVRGVLLQVHLWLSLLFGVVILIACVTGAALVYRHEIDRALNPSLYEATAGDAGWDAAWSAARTRYPGLETALVRGPVDRRVYQVEIGDRLLPRAVHVDPGTGRILGEHDPPSTLAGWLFLLHFNMFAGDTGHAIVGVAGAVLVVITLTGIWLWWPTFRRFAFGFRIRWRRPAFVLNYDVHRVVGIVSLPLVFVVALTGMFLVFYGVGSRVVHALFLTTPEAAAETTTMPHLAKPARAFPLPLSLDDTANIAATLLPGSRPSSMYISGPRGANVKVWLRAAGDIRPNVGSWHVWVDRASGMVTSAMLPQNTPLAAHADETWVIALHYGTYGGEIVRLVYFVGGLIPVMLLGTGVAHWWLRRRRPQRTSELSAT